MRPGETVAQMRERLLAERAIVRDKDSEEFQARMARMDRSFEKLEAERAALHPVQCSTCGDQRVVSDASNPRHVKAVPCPDCKPDQTSAQQADDLNWLIAWYEEHGDPHQTVIDFGDDN